MSKIIANIKKNWLEAIYADKVLFPNSAKRIGVYLLYGLSLCALLLCGIVLSKGYTAMAIIFAGIGFYLLITYFSLWMGKATRYINEKEKPLGGGIRWN